MSNFSFDLDPITPPNQDHSKNALGTLPENVDLQPYSSYQSDMAPLLKKYNENRYSSNLFTKPKNSSNHNNKKLPEPIDFSKTTVEELVKSKTALKKEKERQKKYGEGNKLTKWFDMRRPEITEDLENDLKALHNRNAYDPKAIFRKNDRSKFTIPKNFEVGKVIHNPLEHNKNNYTKKAAKRSFVDSLLADEKVIRHQKKKMSLMHAAQMKNDQRGKRFDVKKHKRTLKRRKEKAVESRKKN